MKLAIPNIKNLSRTIFRVEALLGVMVVLSITALIIPRDWITRQYSLDITSLPVQLFDDKPMGGNSHVRWLDKETHAWSCTLQTGFADPFCSYQLTILDADGRGLDLRRFETLSVHVDYEGDGKYLRLYLRNRNPKYYVLSDVTSTKYNEVELPLEELKKGYTFSLKDFRVASWWLTAKNIPLEYSHPDFNDVVFLELQTGSGLRSGTHNIRLRNISWQGPVINEANLYRYIIICWLISILLVLLYHVAKLSLELSRQRKNQDDLVAVNQLLNLQNKQFEELAKTDPLTGALNRLGIRDCLRQGLENWKRYRTPFSLVLFDLDDFKRVNDFHGHDVGDAILISVAKLMSEHVRKSDFLARWGGEEFILVCPRTNIDEAHAVAELLRKKLAETEIYPNIHITASLGVATLSQPDLDHMFKQADEALYEAKNNGKNKVVSNDGFVPGLAIN